MKWLERFEYCDKDIKGYINKTCQKLPDKKNKEVLKSDKSLQIISAYKSAKGFTIPFSKPVKSIICIFHEEKTKDEYEELQSTFDAIGKYFDDTGEIEKKLERFEYCHNDVIPYITRALDRLFPEKRQVVQAVIDNGSLQIITSHIKKDKPYFAVKFRKPPSLIIYINWEILEKETDDYKIYGIAHEIGHCFTHDSESRLLEKEANDWLRKWGNFEDIIENSGHSAPKDETEGHTCGYSWANTQDKDWLWEAFSPYLVLWDKKELYKKQVDEIIDRLKSKVKGYLVLDEEDCNTHYLEGLAFGIMKRVREILEEEKKPWKGGD